uniref:Apple domain-containing protein n=1 Tax=Syphacia muris TaxID=451379 RepID=A0A0N5AM36_9BILA
MSVTLTYAVFVNFTLTGNVIGEIAPVPHEEILETCVKTCASIFCSGIAYDIANQSCVLIENFDGDTRTNLTKRSMPYYAAKIWCETYADAMAVGDEISKYLTNALKGVTIWRDCNSDSCLGYCAYEFADKIWICDECRILHTVVCKRKDDDSD